MPDKTKEQSLSHVEDIKSQNTNHLVQHKPELKGEVDIEVRQNGRFNIIVYKGTDNKRRKIEDISKNEMLDMIREQL